MMSKAGHFPWIELAAALSGGGFERNRFVRADDVQAVRSWREQHGNRDVYASVCRFERPDRASRFLCPFFADFDAEDPRDVAGEVLKACELLEERVGVEPSCVELHFSGAKGFHLLVHLAVFGGRVVPQAMNLWRLLARRLEREGVQGLDLGIYQSSRVLRLANSLNSKSGLYKIPIEHAELQDLGVEHVLEQARHVREDDSLAAVAECPQAVQWFCRAIESVQRRSRKRPDRPEQPWRFRKGWRVPPCVRRLEQATLPDGLRHAAYFALARFYAWIGMHPAEAETRLLEIDSRHPIEDDGYIRRVVESGARYAGFAGCDDPALAQYCDSRECFLAQWRQRRAGGRQRDGRRRPKAAGHSGECA